MYDHTLLIILHVRSCYRRQSSGWACKRVAKSAILAPNRNLIICRGVPLTNETIQTQKENVSAWNVAFSITITCNHTSQLPWGVMHCFCPSITIKRKTFSGHALKKHDDLREVSLVIYPKGRKRQNAEIWDEPNAQRTIWEQNKTKRRRKLNLMTREKGNEVCKQRDANGEGALTVHVPRGGTKAR